MPHCWYRQSKIAVVQHLSPTLTQATWSSAETDYPSTMPVCRDCCHHSRVPVVMAVWPGCIYSPCIYQADFFFSLIKIDMWVVSNSRILLTEIITGNIQQKTSESSLGILSLLLHISESLNSKSKWSYFHWTSAEKRGPSFYPRGPFI